MKRVDTDICTYLYGLAIQFDTGNHHFNIGRFWDSKLPMN